jgi:hypothetical protein
MIDVTSLLRLWSCHINHNISATQTQPILTDRQTHLNRVSQKMKSGLLICRFFWCFDQQIWISQNFRCYAFLCPGFTMKSVCLSVVLFFFCGISA